MDSHFDALLNAILDGGIGLDLHRLEPIEEVAITNPVPRTHARRPEAPGANFGAKALNPDRCRTVGEGAKTFGQLVWRQECVRVGRGSSVHNAADRTGCYGFGHGK
jgi:hypothetical protein